MNEIRKNKEYSFLTSTNLGGEVCIKFPVCMVLSPLYDVLVDLGPAVRVRLVPEEGAAGRGELLEPGLLRLSGTI